MLPLRLHLTILERYNRGGTPLASLCWNTSESLGISNNAINSLYCQWNTDKNWLIFWPELWHQPPVHNYSVKTSKMATYFKCNSIYCKAVQLKFYRWNAWMANKCPSLHITFENQMIAVPYVCVRRECQRQRGIWSSKLIRQSNKGFL